MKYRLRAEKAVVVIQSYYRGWRVRHFAQKEAAVVVIQSYYRGWRVRYLVERERAAIVIQSYFRGWKVSEMKSVFSVFIDRNQLCILGPQRD